MYGGSMFCKSVDSSAQGIAIAKAESLWEMECMSVCKAKYQPFRVVEIKGKAGKKKDEKEPSKKEPMFGCSAHHHIRLDNITKHGPRAGWVDFEQFHGK
jgi:hypothetical protein